MRIVAFSMLIVAGAAVSNAKDASDHSNPIEYIEIASEQGVDMNVVGQTISEEHRTEWEVRNRIRQVCDGCKVYEQPYPGDLEEDEEKEEEK